MRSPEHGTGDTLVSGVVPTQRQRRGYCEISVYLLILKKSNFRDLSQKLLKVGATCRRGRKLDKGEDVVCGSHFANVQIFFTFPTFF